MAEGKEGEEVVRDKAIMSGLINASGAKSTRDRVIGNR